MALKVMVEEEEKSRPRTEAGDTWLIGLPKETNVAHAEAEERYDGTVVEGEEKDALSTCKERPDEDKTETLIVCSDQDIG